MTSNAAFRRENYDTSYAFAGYGIGDPVVLFESDPELCHVSCLRTANCLAWAFTAPNCGGGSGSEARLASGANATCYMLREFRHGNTYSDSCRRVAGYMNGWPNDLSPRPA